MKPIRLKHLATRLLVGIVATLIAGITTESISHEARPNFIPSFCCNFAGEAGRQDCFKVPCADVEQGKDGKWYYEGQPYNHAWPTQNGKCYECTYNGERRCIFFYAGG